MTNRHILLCGSAFFLLPTAAIAQEVPAGPLSDDQQQADTGAAPTPADAEPLEEEDGQTIVVTGAKPRGSVIGDIPPENTLTARDVRATGATDINELLDAIAPQLGSARGRGGERPILLLNGQRISGFRELRDIPTEAISRMEILPEEVALKYGYRADQKVVNIVLRERFRSTAASLRGQAATEGGYVGGAADATRLMIGRDSRTSVNLHAEGNTGLTEDERSILADPDQPPTDPAARSLIGTKADLRATLTHNRQIGTVAATGNVELEHNEGRSLVGVGETLLEPLARDTKSDSAHAGFVLNGNLSDWRWSVTGNGDAERNVVTTDRDSGVSERGISEILSADVDAMANGTLLRLPAGDAGATFRIGASTLHLDSERRGVLGETSNSLGRTRGFGAVNFDLPVSRRNSDFAALGTLTLNSNAQVDQLSDFGTLTTFGAGLNWSPVVRLNFISSWTREEGAPTIQQLGDPVLVTPESRIFDFTTGQTVLATAITGGNPQLDADSRSIIKIGANWQPIKDMDLRLRGEFVRSRIDDPISSFPGATAELEAAFPERFLRNGAGELVSVDLRPVNFDSARRDTLRIGFDFSKPLKSAPPSQAAMEAFRARRPSSPPGAPGDGRGPQRDAGAPDAAPSGEAAGRGGGFGRFGGGGGRNGGRLTFSITDTITLVDRVTIRDGLELDYLGGDALGQSGGRARHEVEARAGYFNNGLGARVSANWRSGTSVTNEIGDTLKFSPLATFDLRLWANLGQRFDLVAKHPWLRGSSVYFDVKNVFNSKPKVRSLSGDVPFGYQPDLLDPLGRTVSITVRKLFLPSRASFRRSEGSGGED